MTTEKEMIDQLRKGKLAVPPLTFRLLEAEPGLNRRVRIKALVEASWQEKAAKFAVECKALSTPKAFNDGVNLLKALGPLEDCHPMLFSPFLNPDQLRQLEQEGISGIDLCGNAVVIVPGLFAVFRSGGKNLFPSSAPIKNVYRRNTSMVGRVFFDRSTFDTVREVHSEINRRNFLVNRWEKKPMSLSTVSKALFSLEQDLIIERREMIRLLQPEKLLEKLSANYLTPNVRAQVRLKVSEPGQNIRKLLLELSQELSLPLVATGTSSVERYAVLQRPDVLSVYCPCIEKLLERVPGSQTDRFHNLEFLETEDETVFFGARQEDGFWWASPVQVYLELVSGDKRDRETAEQVKSLLLEQMDTVER